MTTHDSTDASAQVGPGRAQTGKLLVGIDMGGTTIKVGLVDESGALHARQTVPTGGLSDKDSQHAFASMVRSIVGDKQGLIRGVGFAVPGPVDRDGNLRMGVNVDLDLPGMLQALQREFPSAWVRALNDANAAAFGECNRGAAVGRKDVLLVTLGTGVGAGVVTDGKVLVGARGIAGEIGHMCVEASGVKCNCGRYGCLEQYSSARGLIRLMRESALQAGDERSASVEDARQVMEAFERSNPHAVHAMEVFSDRLGYALANIACVIDPEVILLGGGVSERFDLFEDMLRASFDMYALGESRSVEFRKAALGNEAGMVGAALFSIAQ
ncbi:ROK family protein [Slackia heliotrinireducens]|uniref:ROK family protein n=1 Tax=Slackia heliotrinireducens TaxID=84110 RepID=UPI0033161181